MSVEQFAIPICRHVKTSGTRCQSPTLQGESFCYFHLRLHKEHPRQPSPREMINRRNLQYAPYEEALIGAGEDPMQIARAYPDQNEYDFPALEDAESIQLAASMLYHAVSRGQIHLGRARILRDILRVASASCGRIKPSPEAAQSVVREVEHTPEGVTIARTDEPAAPEPSSPEPIQNQESTDNQPENKNLAEARSPTPTESGFCEFSPSPASTEPSIPTHLLSTRDNTLSSSAGDASIPIHIPLPDSSMSPACAAM